ncbi:LOW QUALITY PROTEIN: ATP-dependent RNA helicase A [Pseudoliparis swirei]|uniref:LOW QUALITY PROTEIN: ATP-dependent RNA helicase A n=1 Tax=Pseudoliparis swirei TaxID=2059687 RepID=UPI0024BE9C05|nr:LOW QUALITY PROTEIN: ATP-dependent RNA helicase A [Pseudoliparis swirei]
MADIKNFLYAWCGKKKLTPSYDIRTAGNKNRQKFMCEARVESYSYTGMGNSTNKKDAQTNAARDFVNYLVRTGEMRAEEVPAPGGGAPPCDPPDGGAGGAAGAAAGAGGADGGFGSLPSSSPLPPHLVLKSENEEGESCRPVPGVTGLGYSGGGNSGWRGGGGGAGGAGAGGAGGEWSGGANLKEYYAKRDEQEAQAESEEVDLNASLHGNWTLENAKARLNQFFQKEKTSAEYKYSQVGPDHNRSFIAEMQLVVRQLGRKVTAREHGSTKKLAAQSCSLSLVRQLFHLQVLEAFSGTTRRREGQPLEVFEVQVPAELQQQLVRMVQDLGVHVPPAPEDPSQPVSLVQGKLASFEPAPRQSGAGVVPWSPPQVNWNPWTSSNIDEGPLAFCTAEQISRDLQEELLLQQEHDLNLQKILSEREQLPVRRFQEEVLSLVQAHAVVLVRGPTGCGKTTQVPQYILDSFIRGGRASDCNIVVTQPRRISAVSVAERVSFERGEEVGRSCGYSVRFESVLPRPHASILFCTVGVLLRKLESGIRGISHVIVDEIHERDLNTDFLMVVLRDVVQAYPQVRVLLMSATIDTSMFREYFFNAPVVEVCGRTFSVQEYFLEDCIQMTHFVPPPLDRKKKDKEEEGAEEEEANCNVVCGPEYSEETRRSMAQMSEKETSFELVEQILKYLETLPGPGAALVFLPGWNLIASMQRHLEANPHFGSSRYRIMPLHSQIPREEQRRVFEPVPDHIRKVILSTNIAETSITINDVVYVIDSCKQKVKLFTAHNNMTNFSTLWASRTSLEQRSGRAGRVRPGFCFHLCSRARLQRLETHMTPEIPSWPLLHEVALSTAGRLQEAETHAQRFKAERPKY